jgi:hypothetical protein
MEEDGDCVLLGVGEEVLDEGVVEGEVGADLSESLAAALLIVAHIMAEVLFRGVALVARVEVHEGDEVVGIGVVDSEDILDALDALGPFGVNRRQEYGATDTAGFEQGAQLFPVGVGTAVGIAGAGKDASMGMAINQHKYSPGESDIEADAEVHFAASKTGAFPGNAGG